MARDPAASPRPTRCLFTRNRGAGDSSRDFRDVPFDSLQVGIWTVWIRSGQKPVHGIKFSLEPGFHERLLESRSSLNQISGGFEGPAGERHVNKFVCFEKFAK